VVLFGERLPERAVRGLIELSSMNLDLVIAIGTSSSFPYIIRPVVEASQRGIPTVEINPAQTNISDIVTYRLQLGAAEAMEKIWASFSRGGHEGRPAG
jgi:NAD-dependent deacetylase